MPWRGDIVTQDRAALPVPSHEQGWAFRCFMTLCISQEIHAVFRSSMSRWPRGSRKGVRDGSCAGDAGTALKAVLVWTIRPVTSPRCPTPRRTRQRSRPARHDDCRNQIRQRQHPRPVEQRRGGVARSPGVGPGVDHGLRPRPPFRRAAELRAGDHGRFHAGQHAGARSPALIRYHARPCFPAST